MVICMDVDFKNDSRHRKSETAMVHENKTLKNLVDPKCQNVYLLLRLKSQLGKRCNFF